MPVWLTVLLAVLAIFSPGALIGVWLGTSMSQSGAKELSKQTLDGQRLLANDAAVREWRRQQVAPYLEAASQRAHFWVELFLETNDYERLQEGLSWDSESPDPARLAALRERTADPRFFGRQLTIRSVPDRAFRDAFEHLYAYELDYRSRVGYTGEELVDILKQVSSATAALNEAAERYIFSPPTE